LPSGDLLNRLVDVVFETMRDCLKLEKGDSTLIVSDRGSADVALVISTAARRLGVEPFIVNIDSLGRPLRALPASIESLVEDIAPSYTFYVAGTLRGEGPFRAALIEKALSVGAGHVHMPKVTLGILGRLAGCRETAEIISRLHDVLSSSRELHVTSRGGSDVVVEVGRYRWRANTGIIGRGEWDNWPPGEVFTTPYRVDGRLVVDGVLGDYFSVKYGLLPEPVVVEFEDSMVADVRGGPIAKEFYDYISGAGECGLRAGEVGIGGNPHIKEPIGNMLHDEKMPGAHIAVGDPLGSATGAGWRCSVHVDMLPLYSNVSADGRSIIREGVLLSSSS